MEPINSIRETINNVLDQHTIHHTGVAARQHLVTALTNREVAIRGNITELAVELGYTGYIANLNDRLDGCGISRYPAPDAVCAEPHYVVGSTLQTAAEYQGAPVGTIVGGGSMFTYQKLTDGKWAMLSDTGEPILRADAYEGATYDAQSMAWAGHLRSIIRFAPAEQPSLNLPLGGYEPPSATAIERTQDSTDLIRRLLDALPPGSMVEVHLHS